MDDRKKAGSKKIAGAGFSLHTKGGGVERGRHRPSTRLPFPKFFWDLKFEPYLGMSALPPKADKQRLPPNVRLVPKADICSAANCRAIRSPHRRWRGHPAEW